LATEQLHIGGRCPGNLTIEAGATVTTTDIFTCGTYAEVGGSGRGIGLARIRDAGSHLDMSAATGFLGIGNEGDGTLILEQGGTMTSGAQGVFVGTWPGSTGTLVIRDPGSLWAAHNPGLGFTVGLDSATGSVTIENGGALSVSGTTWIGFGGTSVGTLESDGAGSLVSCPVIVVGRELPELTSGSLTVSNGASVAASDRIEVRASGHVVIEGGVLDSPLVAIDGGNLEGAGSIAGDLQNTGSLRVTRASGAHLLASVYVQDHDGSMIVEAGGTVAGQDYGVLQVSQVAFLDGELRLAFDASYTPSVGDSFHVLEYGLRAGSFSSITASGLPANLDLSASYGTSELTITVGVLATSFCECAAGGPCGNDSPDAGCANSTLSGAHLSAAGSRSVARDDLVLTAMNLPPSQPGLFFMGRSIAAAPFGDGLRCVGGTLYRFPIAQASGAGLISLGPGLAGYASTHFPAAGQIMAGQVRSFQCWYRDPGTPCGSAVNLSNAVELVFAP
jgi:T5SS/PEP-CTERM-associated repeat protein